MTTSLPENIRAALQEPYVVSDEQIKAYRQNGYLTIKQVLPADILRYMNNEISAAVAALNTEKIALEDRDTYGKAFLQVMNIWTKFAAVKEIVFSKKMASIATTLMEVKGVRLYHDQALFKEPGGGYTPWHADQYYWPLHSDKTITAWIPLQAVPLTMGPLEFSAGSQRLEEGRMLKISDDSENLIQQKLTLQNFPKIVAPFDAGEVSFHSGWTYHRAGPNTTDQMRKVMTIIYMDKDMRLQEPINDNQQADWEAWCPGARVGEIIQTHLNPILYETL